MIAHRLLVGSLALALAGLAPPELSARPLASIKERGSIMLCANPNALPYAARNGERPGFQVELARALAKELGVGLEIGWVVFPFHIPRVDCDIVLDSIADKAIQGERRVRLSRPYQQSGVALAFRAGVEPVASYRDLKPGLRIGTMVSSLARLTLARHGLNTIPFAFEDEMMEALGKGEIDVAAVSPATAGYYNHVHPRAPVAATMAFASEPELNWSVAVGMRKADDALVGSIDEALEKLIADGTLDRIYTSYGVEQRLPQP